MATPPLARLKFLCLIFLSACATQPQPVLAPFDQWFSDKSVYIKKSCQFIDLNMNLQRALPALHCLPTPNGILMATRTSFFAFDNNLKNHLWKYDGFYVHHQLNTSEINDDILTLKSEYTQEADGRQLRNDVLVVLNKKGQIKKSFDFGSYFKKINADIPPAENNWTTDGLSGKSIEKSHFNSFRELYKTINGEKNQTGYLAFDAQQNKVYILDKNLKKVVRVLPFNTKRAHDVRQFSENELIYFLNEDSNEPLPRQSKIEIYDMRTDQTRVLYKSDQIKTVYRACGSVQQLPHNQLFIHYNRCKETLKGADQNSYFELVDLNTNTSRVAAAPVWLLGDGAYLLNQLPPAL